MHRSYGLQGSLKRRRKHPTLLLSIGIIRQKIVLAQSSTKRPTFAFTGESGYTLGFRRRIAHSGSQGETGAFRTGGGITLPSDHFARFGNPARPGIRKANFAAFGLGRMYSQRTQRACGTAMRSCASLSRGVAAPPGCVIFFASVEIGICTSGAHGFPRVRGMGGITTLGVLRVLSKRWTAACQKGSFAVF